MCGAPGSIKDVREGSYIYKVQFTGFQEPGVLSLIFDGEPRENPYMKLGFKVVESIKGPSKQEVYIAYLSKYLSRYRANPPKEVSGFYLVSIIPSKDEDGSFERPFIHGPCDLQVRK